MQWPEPWHDVSDQQEANGLAGELHRELSKGHPLFGVAVRTLARRHDCDDVLFALEDDSGQVAVVHLTWTMSPPERLPWPDCTLYPSLDQWVMQQEHGEGLGDGSVQ